ncbi:hypothetical protein MMC18_009357 [Xylographa bjoerkii]|nr:hypothetical protein [Xylographa bjoerkii]
MDTQHPTNRSLQAGSQCLAALSILKVLDPRPKSTYPSQSWSPHLPCISRHRLQEAAIASSPKTPLTAERPTRLAPSPKEPTVLYLAYGSNLCAETFQGRRGIRPLAATNVVVPTLTMTFDLPGVPYAEPCFANTAYRDARPPPYTAHPPLPNHHHHHHHHHPAWPHGLVGVVYEVTRADYAHIIATEGGGAGYQDITVACHPLVPGAPSVPSQPSSPPFAAHTLFAPSLPAPPPPPRSPPSGLPRPSPSHAQPSARYLRLIRAGAAEHAFPPDYAAYLAGLRAYTITSQKQQLGQFVFLAVWLPIVLFLLGLAQVYGGEGGRSPRWLLWLTGRVFAGMWTCYDGLFRGLFGEGERTVEGDGGDGDDGDDGDGGWWPGEGDGVGEKGGLGGVGGARDAV